MLREDHEWLMERQASTKVRHAEAKVAYEGAVQAVKDAVQAKRDAFEEAQQHWRTLSKRSKRLQKQQYTNTVEVELEKAIDNAKTARFEARIVLSEAVSDARAVCAYLMPYPTYPTKGWDEIVPKKH